MGRSLQVFSAVLTIVACGLLITSAAWAETLKSTNYTFDEPTVGAGSLNQSTSTNYKGIGAYGDLGVGNSASSNFQVNAGSQTNPDPVLSVEIITTNTDFGQFSAATPSTTTAQFTVINYSSYGYAVQLDGTPPTHNTHAIDTMLTTESSLPGTEQFGINLVANTSPSTFGANHDNGSFGFGQIGEGPASPNYGNYSTPNKFRYVPGETIASAPKSSGKTIYTISFLVNVSGITPGGSYVSNQVVIVTGTY
ncbi:MAG: hypothetical protein WAQ25_03810 [Candidatus Saccharimonas sp.]